MRATATSPLHTHTRARARTRTRMPAQTPPKPRSNHPAQQPRRSSPYCQPHDTFQRKLHRRHLAPLIAASSPSVDPSVCQSSFIAGKACAVWGSGLPVGRLRPGAGLACLLPAAPGLSLEPALITLWVIRPRSRLGRTPPRWPITSSDSREHTMGCRGGSGRSAIGVLGTWSIYTQTLARCRRARRSCGSSKTRD